jgi:hypothetical protein
LFYFHPECLQKAKRSYQKDIANFQEARESHAQALNAQDEGNKSIVEVLDFSLVLLQFLV